ncbi:hypothetical protein EMMF5_000077 [Cystobasidiomycetes sp. EMM_F5]
MQTAGRSLKRPCSAILHGPVKSLRLQRALQTSSPSSPGSSAENKLDDVDAKLNRLETILAELNADRRRNNDSGRRAQSHEQSATSDGSFTSGGRGSGQQNGSAIDTALGLAMGGYDPILELEKAARSPSSAPATHSHNGQDEEEESAELQDRIQRHEQPLIDRIMRGEERGHYWLLLGPKGSGKTSMVIQAVRFQTVKLLSIEQQADDAHTP